MSHAVIWRLLTRHLFSSAMPLSSLLLRLCLRLRLRVACGVSIHSIALPAGHLTRRAVMLFHCPSTALRLRHSSQCATVVIMLPLQPCALRCARPARRANGVFPCELHTDSGARDRHGHCGLSLSLFCLLPGPAVMASARSREHQDVGQRPTPTPTRSAASGACHGGNRLRLMAKPSQANDS